MYIHPGLLAPRPSALRRDLGSRFELQKGQTIVFPRIVVGFFGIEAVVNYDVQGRFLHDRDFSLSQDTASRCHAAARELVRNVEPIEE
jgi:hypothetical protein